MKFIYNIFQPLLCYLHLHDWYQGRRSGERECECCKRVEVFDHADNEGRAHWRLK